MIPSACSPGFRRSTVRRAVTARHRSYSSVRSARCCLHRRRGCQRRRRAYRLLAQHSRGRWPASDFHRWCVETGWLAVLARWRIRRRTPLPLPLPRPSRPAATATDSGCDRRADGAHAVRRRDRSHRCGLDRVRARRSVRRCAVPVDVPRLFQPGLEERGVPCRCRWFADEFIGDLTLRSWSCRPFLRAASATSSMRSIWRATGAWARRPAHRADRRHRALRDRI